VKLSVVYIKSYLREYLNYDGVHQIDFFTVVGKLQRVRRRRRRKRSARESGKLRRWMPVRP
jgi:hypothetical protein